MTRELWPRIMARLSGAEVALMSQRSRASVLFLVLPQIRADISLNPISVALYACTPG